MFLSSNNSLLTFWNGKQQPRRIIDLLYSGIHTEVLSSNPLLIGAKAWTESEPWSLSYKDYQQFYLCAMYLHLGKRMNAQLMNSLDTTIVLPFLRLDQIADAPGFTPQMGALVCGMRSVLASHLDALMYPQINSFHCQIKDEKMSESLEDQLKDMVGLVYVNPTFQSIIEFVTSLVELLHGHPSCHLEIMGRIISVYLTISQWSWYHYQRYPKTGTMQFMSLLHSQVLLCASSLEPFMSTWKESIPEHDDVRLQPSSEQALSWEHVKRIYGSMRLLVGLIMEKIGKEVEKMTVNFCETDMSSKFYFHRSEMPTAPSEYMVTMVQELYNQAAKSMNALIDASRVSLLSIIINRSLEMVFTFILQTQESMNDMGVQQLVLDFDHAFQWISSCEYVHTNDVAILKDTDEFLRIQSVLEVLQQFGSTSQVTRFQQSQNTTGSGMTSPSSLSISFDERMRMDSSSNDASNNLSKLPDADKWSNLFLHLDNH
eukprot:TRINITY_DN2440_c0_g1_i2.p1 TRINITY_DN2440_c0_g1~~TRINITY_DN2440_c0_g1_i2.p1  ORF type:complete len:486 (-),score=83.87 TRINITY_DN2440_c0_g1_i2:108-1565(-)